MNVCLMLTSNNPKWNPPRKLVQEFMRKFPRINFLRQTDNITEADVIFGWIIDKETLKIAKGLKWFHTAGVQYGHLQPIELYEKAVVTNSRGVWKDYLANTVIDSIQKIIPLVNLKGKTAGIIGLGENGGEIAKRLHKVGMKVIATKKTTIKKPSYVEELFQPNFLNHLLEKSDLIILSVPSTDETKNLINKDNLKLAKKDAIIISTSRSEVVNNDDLIAFLDNGHLGAAIIDTMWPEKYQKHEKIVTFIHMSPEHHDIWPKMFELFGENLKRFLNGKELLNRIYI